MYPVDDLHILPLNAGLGVQHGDWNWEKVRSPFSRLYLVTEGYAEVELPDGIQPLTPGHMYFIPAFTTHRYICHSLFTHYYLHIYEYCDAGISVLDRWHLPTEIEATELALPLFQCLCSSNPLLRLVQSDPMSYDNQQTLLRNIQQSLHAPVNTQVESRGILLLLLSHFFAKAEPVHDIRDTRVLKALDFFSKNIGGKIDAERLAAEACLSRDHFAKIFRREMGMPPSAYIIMKKMERAELLLVTTDMSVRDIALRLGYDDHSYFIRLFCKTVGRTPLQYRLANSRRAPRR